MGLEPNSNSNNKKCEINKKCSTYLKIIDLISIKVSRGKVSEKDRT